MQVSNVSGVNFSSKFSITPEELEARAEALEKMEIRNFEESINPEIIADVLDGKLKKTEKGRKIVNAIVSCTGFAAAALSFKKVAPKVRKGISAATAKVAKSFSSAGSKVNNKNIQEVASSMGEKAQEIAQKGDGTKLKAFVNRIFGKKAPTVINGMEHLGIKTGADAADTALALGLATMTGREAGDRADNIQKEASLKDTVKDFVKIAGAFSGADVITDVIPEI